MSAASLFIKKKKNLRTGYTTGACASAAAKAAAIILIQQRSIDRVGIRLPMGGEAIFDIVSSSFNKGYAECSVRKDSGDDPDVTNGAEINARVSWTDQPVIRIERGEGVGVVTKPGIGLEIGSPAINPVPIKMITYSVEEVIKSPPLPPPLITLSVPHGKEIARKTLNHRLGIVDGISILGTTGIVHPYSISAFIKCIIQSIDVAIYAGCRELVFTTGRRSEKFVQGIVDIRDEAFILVGDLIGVGLKIAANKRIRKIIICGMPGKIFKMAQGYMYTHSTSSWLDMDRFMDSISGSDRLKTIRDKIRGINTARHLYELLIEDGGDDYTFNMICQMVCETARGYVKERLSIECILTDFEGNILGRAFH